jgi:curli biogenesis system outer membrane secretion channel CsgG
MKIIIIAVLAIGALPALTGGMTTPSNSTTVTPTVSAQAVNETKTPTVPSESSQTQSNNTDLLSQVLPDKVKGKSFYEKASSVCYPDIVESMDETNSIAECKSLKGKIKTVIVK